MGFRRGVNDATVASLKFCGKRERIDIAIFRNSDSLFPRGDKYLETLPRNWSRNFRRFAFEPYAMSLFVRCSAARPRVSEVSLATAAAASAYTDTRGRRCKSCVAWKLKRERSVSSATSSTKYGGSRGRGRMLLVGPSGFDGGAAAGGFPPARESCTNTLEGRRVRVDKSNAPNATIFCHSLYYRRSEPRRTRSSKELSTLTVKAVEPAFQRSGKYYLEGKRRGKGNIVRDERPFPLILSVIKLSKQPSCHLIIHPLRVRQNLSGVATGSAAI